MRLRFHIFFFRSIYHFDPSNLPPCGKLQIPNASPTTSPLPNENVQSRKKNRTSNAAPAAATVAVAIVDETNDVQCDKQTVPIEKCGARKTENEKTSELEVTLPEPTKNISMNALLSPLNKVFAETKDNNLDRIVTGTPSTSKSSHENENFLHFLLFFHSF